MLNDTIFTDMSENINSNFGEVYRQEWEKKREELVGRLAEEIIEKQILKPEIQITPDFEGVAVLENEAVDVQGQWGEFFGNENVILMNIKGREQPIPLDELKVKNPSRETDASEILFNNFGFKSFQDARDALNDKNRSSVRVKAETAVEIFPVAVERALSLDPDLSNRSLMDFSNESEIIPNVWLGVKEANENILFEKDNPFESQIKKIDKLRDAVERAGDNKVAREKATEILYKAVNNAFEDLITEGEPDDLRFQTLEILYTSEMERLNEELNPTGRDDFNRAAEKMAVAAEKMVESTEKFVIKIEDLTTVVDPGVIDGYSDQIGDPEMAGKMKSQLGRETGNAELREKLHFNQAVKQIKRSAENYNDRERFSGDLNMIYEYLDYIERGTSNVDDLSRNADKFRVLYKISNGDFDKLLENNETVVGRNLEKKDVELLKTEISMRMWLHSFQLAMSKCKSMEDYLRTVSSMHEGDLDHSSDKVLMSFFLETKENKKGSGLREIPVSLAWNLRQEGYYKIEQLIERLKGSNNFVEYLKENKDNLFKQVLEKGNLENIFTYDPVISKNKKFGIMRDYYPNFFVIQKNGGLDAEIIKEFMIWEMMQKTDCGENNAKKAYELGQKLSLSTMCDSRANIVFAADDYSELENIKKLRFSDGPGFTPGLLKLPKNKFVGSLNTIERIDALACNWLDLSRKKGLGMMTVDDPVFAEDIDFNKINAKADMMYHLNAVVFSQVVPIKEAFFRNVTPKEVLVLGNLNSMFAKINKTSYDMCRARLVPMYREDMSFYDGLLSGDKTEVSRTEAAVAEKMRKYWIMNIFEIAKDPLSGWNYDSLSKFINNLKRSSTIVDQSGRSTGFISKKELDNLLENTKVEKQVKRNDSDAQYRGGRH
jgi:hypothetical protein